MFILNSILAYGIMMSVAAGKFWNLYDTEIRPLIPIILIISFISGGLFNIGKVWSSDDRDWKGYFKSIGIFIACIVALLAGVEIVKALAGQF